MKESKPTVKKETLETERSIVHQSGKCLAALTPEVVFCAALLTLLHKELSSRHPNRWAS